MSGPGSGACPPVWPLMWLSPAGLMVGARFTQWPGGGAGSNPVGAFVRVHVVRDVSVAAGGVSWFMLPGELVIVGSAVGMSAVGAEALEVALAHFMEPGDWVGCRVGGEPLVLRWFLTDRVDRMCPPAPVLITSRGALVKVYLSPEHFCPVTVDGFRRGSLEYCELSRAGALDEVSLAA